MVGLRFSIGIALLASACSLIGTSDLRPESDDAAGASGGGGGPVDCGPCDDSNPCTRDACEDGRCVHVAETPDLPNEDLTDCSADECVDGEIVATADDTEVPPPTGDPCTEAVCSGGTATILPRPDGTVCGASLDVCTMGVCGSACVSTVQCPDPVEPCVDRIRCANGACKAVLVDAGDAAEDMFQSAGDCQELVCVGSAAETMGELDVGDPGSDDNDCTEDTCEQPGTTKHTPRPDLTACEDGRLCRAGACSNCLLTEECADASTGSECLATGLCGCTSAADCSFARYCSTTSMCLAKKPLGAACGSPVECQSGRCDGGNCSN